MIGPHCGLYAQNHGYERFDAPIAQQDNIGKGIYLMGDNWIGSHSVLCDDVTLGKGAIIGANSTVTKSIPLASIAIGSPARVVKKRYTGTWDFNKVERASYYGMPSEIRNHVENRGEIIRDILASHDEVLDVGCGEGINTAIFAEKCLTIIGCDYSLEAIYVAKQRYPNIDFVYSNSTTLRFDSGRFTKVVLSDVAEHLLPQQFKKTLEEIKRVLVQEGTFILTTPLTAQGKRSSAYAHIYEYSKVEMESILSSVFDDVELVDNQYGLFISRK
jgi:ubiquinone/menaquinone biosynthesis C-methylase UbiE